MRSSFFQQVLSLSQQAMYDRLHRLALSHSTMASLAGIPVSFADVAIETVKSPLSSIENAVFAPINFIGALFCPQSGYKMKDALYNVESALNFSKTTPVAVSMAPFKIFYQCIVNISHPESAESIDYKEARCLSI